MRPGTERRAAGWLVAGSMAAVVAAGLFWGWGPRTRAVTAAATVVGTVGLVVAVGTGERR